MIGIYSDKCICARDVKLFIDGKRLLQASRLEIRKQSAVKSVRSCFCSVDIALIRSKTSYKAILEGVRFLAPFENCNFADLDNFTLCADIDGKRIRLSGGIWEDYLAAADKNSFKEHISARALNFETEELT